MAINVTPAASPSDGMPLSAFLARLTIKDEERDGWLAKCPGHDDSKASLRITVSEDSGKVLLKCRAGCDNPHIMESMGLTIKDLASMVDDTNGEHSTSSNDDLPEESAIAELGDQLNTWALDLDGPTGSDALAYAATRFGIEPEDARRLGLGVTASLGGGPRLVVPFRDLTGRPLGFQARALNNVAQVRWAGPLNPEKASWTRIGFFPGSSGWEEVIITEGPGDALTAVATGYDALAIRGAGLVENAATLDRVAEMLAGRTAIVAGDGDDAGQQFSAKLAEALLARGVVTKILKMRDGLDLSDWRAEDPAWFRQGFVKEVAKLSTVTKGATKVARWPYPFADIGGAQFLRDKLALEGRPLRFTDAAGFYQLENGVWIKRADGDIRTSAQTIGKDLVDVYAGAKDQGNDETANAAWRYKLIVETSRGIDSVLKELKSLPGIRAELADFDRHPHLLAVRNGVVDLKTGNLLPHDPSLLLTRRIDLDFRPATPAPRWMQFLVEVFPDEPLMPAYMQRMIGYGITGETDEQVFIVNYGTGANGKSIFSDVITSIFDPITTITPFSTFEARRGDGVPNDLAALAGARLVMAPEGNQGKLMDEALLKRVTGQDKITARFLRREFFEYRPQFLLFMATNYRPAFKGQDEGLWRRVKLIEWSRYFKPEERDHRLQEKLMAEAEGILAWAIAGAVAWYAGGLQEPASITAVTDDYRKRSDVLAEFLSEAGDSVYNKGDDSDWIARTDLFRAFQDWADLENFKDLANWSSRAFYSSVEERGYPTGKRSGVMGFRRIKKSVVSPFETPAKVEVAVDPTDPASGPDIDLWNS